MNFPVRVYHAWETQEKLTILWVKNIYIINKSLLIFWWKNKIWI